MSDLNLLARGFGAGVLLAIGLSLCACGPGRDEPVLQFRDAWVRAMPPSAKMTAAFGRLENTGDAELEITSFSSPDFESISLHQTVTENSVSRMRAVSDVALAAGSALVLEPSSYHLMLVRPVKDLSEFVEIRMVLSDGSQFSFDVPVERR